MHTTSTVCIDQTHTYCNTTSRLDQRDRIEVLNRDVEARAPAGLAVLAALVHVLKDRSVVHEALCRHHVVMDLSGVHSGGQRLACARVHVGVRQRYVLGGRVIYQDVLLEVVVIPPERRAHAAHLAVDGGPGPAGITRDQAAEGGAQDAQSLAVDLHAVVLLGHRNECGLDPVQVQVALAASSLGGVVYIGVFVHAVSSVVRTHDDDLITLATNNLVIHGVLTHPRSAKGRGQRVEEVLPVVHDQHVLVGLQCVLVVTRRSVVDHITSILQFTRVHILDYRERAGVGVEPREDLGRLGLVGGQVNEGVGTKHPVLVVD